MAEDNIYVGKFINGKKIVDTSSDSKFVNFFFEDGSYDTAPIIDGVVVHKFDVVTVSQETDYVDMEGVILGFYKMLEAVPYTDEEGNEIGKTEIGSIQEVPVALGDSWVALGFAEQAEAPKESVMDKVSSVIGNILGNK